MGATGTNYVYDRYGAGYTVLQSLCDDLRAADILLTQATQATRIVLAPSKTIPVEAARGCGHHAAENL